MTVGIGLIRRRVPGERICEATNGLRRRLRIKSAPRLFIKSGINRLSNRRIDHPFQKLRLRGKVRIILILGKFFIIKLIR